jgi:hypothetical protein
MYKLCILPIYIPEFPLTYAFVLCMWMGVVGVVVVVLVVLLV